MLYLVIMSQAPWDCHSFSFSLFLVSLKAWGALLRYFVENPSIWGCLMFRLRLDQNEGFVGKTTRGQVPSFITSHQLRHYALRTHSLADNSLLLIWPLIAWMSSCVLGFSHRLLFPLFPSSIFWKEVTMHSLHLGCGVLQSTSWSGGQCVHTLFGVLLARFPPPVYLFSTFFRSTWTGGYFHFRL